MRIIRHQELDAEQRAAADRMLRQCYRDGWEPMSPGESFCFWAAIWATPAVVGLIAVWHFCF